MTATWLAEVLRSTGHPVVEHEFWRISGRPGPFDPIGVLWHHTAFKASAANPFPAKDTLIRGRPDLRGPLCNVSPAYDGVLHVIAAGRANHAGVARQSGPIPAGDGNELLIGFELDYSGFDEPSDAQLTAALDGTAAVLAHLGRGASYCRGHRETSVTGKWDPGHVDMFHVRNAVAVAMTAAANPQADTTTRRHTDMFVAKYGRTQFRLVTGDRYVVITPALADQLQKAGIPVVGVGVEDETRFRAELVSEAPTPQLATKE